MVQNSLLHGNFLRESFHRVGPFQLFKLNRGVLVEELVYREVATTDTDVDPVLVNTHCDAFCSELVNSLWLTHEHDLEFLSVGEVVNVLSQSFVDSILLDGDVDSDTALQVNNVLFQSIDLVIQLLDFKLYIFERLQQV